MSRIGNLPVNVPQGVEVKIDDTSVNVKGPKGELKQDLNKDITVKLEDNNVVLERTNEEKQTKALHGLYRSLINNMITGVSEGFTIELELVGVGYRAKATGQLLEMSVGYSHDIFFELPSEVSVEAKQEKRGNPKITLTSCDKQLVGHVAAKIRSFRKPEPYKGKGIKYVDEHIRRKAGKSASV